MPLSASLIMPEGVSPELGERLERAVEKAVGNRNSLDITITDLSESDGVISATLGWNDRSVNITVGEEYLEDELESLFYYEDALFEDGGRLDYIYRSSFSSVTLSGARLGQNYRVLGESGKTEALLRVSSVYDNAVVFTPVFLSSPLPGMKIERASDFSLKLGAFSNLSFSSFGASLSAYYSSLIYPVIPLLEVSVMKEGKTMAARALLGIRCDFHLSSVWSDIPAVKNFSLGGEALLGVAVKGKRAALSTSFSFDVTYSFSRIFSLSAGLKNYDGTNYLSLSLGGRL